ncbi:hypothetical protein C7U61_14580 [Rhizobium sp. JAB6]|nr:hypothetical protein C7U61_14580 [Rhizobium sp. JAB6]
MQTIDHDPQEPKIDRTPGPWRWVFPIIAVLFLANLLTRQIDWISLCLGLGMGCTLAGWAIEITGNKVPGSWKANSRRDGP